MTTPFNIQNLLFLILSLVGLIIVIAALRSRKQTEANNSWSGPSEILNYCVRRFNQ